MTPSVEIERLRERAKAIEAARAKLVDAAVAERRAHKEWDAPYTETLAAEAEGRRVDLELCRAEDAKRSAAFGAARRAREAAADALIALVDGERKGGAECS